MMKKNKVIALTCCLLTFIACKQKDEMNVKPEFTYLYEASNTLNYKGVPEHKVDRNMLMFSDQGAWFSYGLRNNSDDYGGFTGPFLMTQENGVWIGPSLSRIDLLNEKNISLVDWNQDLIDQSSYHSHLEQTYENENLRVQQELVFVSAHTALQRTRVTNLSNQEIDLGFRLNSNLFEDLGIHLEREAEYVKITSDRTDAIGYVGIVSDKSKIRVEDSLSFEIYQKPMLLKSRETKEVLVSQTFIFPGYSWSKEQSTIKEVNFDELLLKRMLEKENQLEKLISRQQKAFKNQQYEILLAKTLLTLQNNWRVPAGELKHAGLFPSYHYKWFHGFWSWDSWKHAVGIAMYDPQLAKDQVRAMFDFQSDDGFIVDCIYRDTTIEAHNYRDTKPPLAAWSVASIVRRTNDTSFAKEMYPKLKKYHYWWYQKRDHDQDGLCEYGSTDGTLIAAKWESGMDNAIRFDDSKILKNDDGAYSLDQESVDLNAYLYADKKFLAYLANVTNNEADLKTFLSEAKALKVKIQDQFYSREDGWFYDTSLDGESFIKGEGSEGWIPLWAGVAKQEQADKVRDRMMDPSKFYTKVPFQTMSKDHSKFDPMNGYWRGPNWIDQAYFGIEGLRMYGYEEEANKATEQVLKGAEGLLGKGASIRENYHPITGKGLNAQNFSWSAAHIIMMLTEE